MRIVILFFICLLGAISAGHGTSSPFKTDRAHMHSDQLLYQKIGSAVGSGESYYDAAPRLQREWHYPVKPFFTVRLPTLAYMMALGGHRILQWTALVGIVSVAVLWTLRLGEASVIARVVTALALLGGGLPLALSPFVFFHEFWAGLMLAVAMAYRGRPAGIWIALAAALIRELAFPYLVLEATAALAARQLGKARAAAAAIAIFGLVLLLHRSAVLAHTRPDDLVSPGWHGMRGLVAATGDIAGLTVLQFLPPALSIALCLLPFAGWFDAPMGRVPFFYFLTMFIVIAAFSRPDNVYWAVIVLPTYFVGLAFVPRFLRGLPGEAGTIRDRIFKWTRADNAETITDMPTA